MAVECRVIRIGDTIRADLLVDGHDLTVETMDVTGDNPLLAENPDGSWCEVDGVDETEFAEFMFPIGLPNGYAVLAFIRRSGNRNVILGCALLGPHGYMGGYSTPDAAAQVAIDEEEGMSSITGATTPKP
jgi:hypothetical protein